MTITGGSPRRSGGIICRSTRSRHVARQFTPERLERRIAPSASYAAAEIPVAVRRGRGRRWRSAMPTTSRSVGIPLPALLSALAFRAQRHAEPGRRPAARTDTAPMRTLGDVVQRLALIEADIMASHLGATDAEAARDGRRRARCRLSRQHRRVDRGYRRAWARASACRRSTPRRRPAASWARRAKSRRRPSSPRWRCARRHRPPPG